MAPGPYCDWYGGRGARPLAPGRARPILMITSGEAAPRVTSITASIYTCRYSAVLTTLRCIALQGQILDILFRCVASIETMDVRESVSK